VASRLSVRQEKNGANISPRWRHQKGWPRGKPRDSNHEVREIKMTQNQNPNQSQNPNQNQSTNQNPNQNPNQNQSTQKSCEVCGQNFKSDRELQEHLKTAHQNQPAEKQPTSERNQSERNQSGRNQDDERGNREKIA
jgi:hypothetical protein